MRQIDGLFVAAIEAQILVDSLIYYHLSQKQLLV